MENRANGLAGQWAAQTLHAGPGRGKGGPLRLQGTLPVRSPVTLEGSQ